MRRKRAEADALEETLIQRELELLSIRQELDAFESRYLRTVGRAFIDLDSLVADIARLLENRRATADGPTQQQCAEENTQTRGATTDADPCPQDAVDSAELKRLYREVAKCVHPDLAESVEDRAVREERMKAANASYLRGDLNGLRAILDEWHSEPEAVQGDSVAAELVRVIRWIARLQTRLADLEAEITRARSSEVANLQRQAAEAEKEGRDLLRDMEVRILNRITHIENLLSAVVTEHTQEGFGD